MMRMNELILEVCRKRGESVAVETPLETATYAELIRRSQIIALHLHARRVPSNGVVAVRLAPSVDAVAALLAVSLVGAKFLPIDVNLPISRARRYVEIAGCHLVICESEEGSKFSEVLTRSSLVDIDGDLPTVLESTPKDSYVLFTSGSTGEPKGVIVEQASFLHALLAREGPEVLSQDDRVLLTASAGFDVSLWQVFATLLAGATLIIPDDRRRFDPEMLAEDIAARNVTVVELVPTMLQLLSTSRALRSATALRLILSVGEPLTVSHVRSIQREYGGLLVNRYGPTEAAIYATHWTVPQNYNGSEVPIGRVYEGVEATILNPDEYGRGELCLGGVRISPGYLNRPEMTARSFIIDAVTGYRRYLTGDICSWGDDAVLNFHGRIDRQVKIRGARVELDEVESGIRSILPTCSVAVVCAMGLSGDSELFACVAGAFDRKQLRKHLLSTFASQMVPSRFYDLEKMPVLANGKTDYGSLKRAIEDGSLHSERAIAAPGTRG